VTSSFPGLPSAERDRFAGLVAEHGVEIRGGVRLPARRAEVEVGYLERLAAARLRKPVARGRPAISPPGFLPVGAVCRANDGHRIC
jgi:hypothetical protein